MLTALTAFAHAHSLLLVYANQQRTKGLPRRARLFCKKVKLCLIKKFTIKFSSLDKWKIDFKNVPCKNSSQCGEEIFSSATMERLDEIISEVTKKLTKICIMEYAPVA